MRRNAMQQLYDWKEKSTRKPLIIRGARQVGKTWLMKEFAKEALFMTALGGNQKDYTHNQQYRGAV